MPFVSIRDFDRAHLPLFGYQLIEEVSGGAWYMTKNGHAYIDNKSPLIWVDDPEEVSQILDVQMLVDPPS